MAYEWEDKQADCYRLYVEEGLSLENTMDWFKRERGFAPRYVYSPPYMADVRYGSTTSWLAYIKDNTSSPCNLEG